MLISYYQSNMYENAERQYYLSNISIGVNL
jgi:hypothetical protein